MILIISNEKEYSTSDIISWLLYFSKKIFRINRNENVVVENILVNNQDVSCKVKIKENSIDIFDVGSYFYRHGELKLDFKITKENEWTAKFLSQEWETLSDFLVMLLEKKKFLGNYFAGNPNKLIQLEMAKECGLNIPTTCITSLKSVLSNYKAKEQWITKAIQENFFTSTQIVSDDKVNAISDTFFPSLIQTNIDKKYELRIFFINNDYYAMAIFSQADEQTKVDFRNYNLSKPNRNVPFKLPFEILNKLKSLMKTMNLNTGSIDMIVDKNNDYYFLEVNPVGQFGMVSYPCNYHLEKKIAQYLAS